MCGTLREGSGGELRLCTPTVVLLKEETAVRMIYVALILHDMPTYT